MQSAVAPSTPPTPRARVAAEVAALCDIVTHARLDDAQLESLHHALAEVHSQIEGDSGGQGRAKWWAEGSPARAYRDRGPFTGLENPRAPGLVVRDVSNAEGLRVEGRVTVTKSFAGPPGAVHGGVVAGLFDEMLGQAAQLATNNGYAVTATLTTRFRQPTPLGVELVFTASVQRRSGRRVRAIASCRAGDAITAEATALLVVHS